MYRSISFPSFVNGVKAVLLWILWVNFDNFFFFEIFFLRQYPRVFSLKVTLLGATPICFYKNAENLLFFILFYFKKNSNRQDEFKKCFFFFFPCKHTFFHKLNTNKHTLSLSCLEQMLQIRVKHNLYLSTLSVL